MAKDKPSDPHTSSRRQRRRDALVREMRRRAEAVASAHPGHDDIDQAYAEGRSSAFAECALLIEDFG